MGYLYANNVNKGENDGKSSSKYAMWNGDAKPNLMTFIDALNLSQPIVNCNFELRMSRWPRTLFFAKSVRIPGLSVGTIDINRIGFTIGIPTNPKYESREITLTIIADKEGYHYQDWRNFVLETGHPLVSGDTRSTIGFDDQDNGEDILDVRLRDFPDDEMRPHHHWTIHNFRALTIGELELSHDSSNLVTFDVTCQFTHIGYDCGFNESDQLGGQSPSTDVGEENQDEPPQASESEEDNDLETQPPPDMNEVEEADEGEESYDMDEDYKEEAPDDWWDGDDGGEEKTTEEGSSQENDNEQSYEYDDGSTQNDATQEFLNNVYNYSTPQFNSPSSNSEHVVRSIF